MLSHGELRIHGQLILGDLLAVRDELVGTIVTLGDWPWSQVRARRGVIPALVPVWVRSGFPVLAELGEQSGEQPGMPGLPVPVVPITTWWERSR
jgi:hypothetical protein